jgi:hypothetical protein
MNGTTPKDIYEQKRTDLRKVQSTEQRLERRIGYTKLLLAAAALCLSPFLVRNISGIVALCIAVLAFVALLVWQEKLLERIRLRARRVNFYERGLARLDGTWKSSGDHGERFLDLSHPYARDLDLFGDSSLFQYLNNARTRGGEETLASWLLHAVGSEEIVERQEAVKELASRLDLREQIFTSGEEIRRAVEPRTLIAWGEAAPVLSNHATRVATSTLAFFWLVAVVTWIVTGEPFFTLLMSVINFAYAHRLYARLNRAAESVESAASELSVMAKLLRIVENGDFESGRLRYLQERLNAFGAPPSESVRRLATLAELIQSRQSLFLRPLDLVLYWSAQLLFVAEGWQRRHGTHIREWISIVGEVEALSSLAAFAYEHPSYAFPQFASNAPLFEAEGLSHPLLDQHAVSNDVRFDGDRALIILSGPNMAGKSTFIRSIGVNAVLAQCGAPVRASRLVLSPMQVAASICVLDSLSGGVSRFYAEIRRLKAIDDMTVGVASVLFLLDELLSGTNSHDRLAGTEFVLRSFVDRGAVGIVSTHDLALTRIAEEFPGRAENFHFEDRLEDGRLVFDYKLKSGIVQTSNALKLMRAVGFGLPDSSDLPPVE